MSAPLLDVMNALIAPVLIAGLVVEVIGTPVYVLLFYLILAKKGERFSGFYVLFIFRAILALLLVLEMNYLIRLPTLNLFAEAYRQMPDGVLIAALVVDPSIIYAEYLVNLAMLANRYTAIGFPLRYKQIWQMKYTLALIALIVLLCLPWGLPFRNVKACVWPGNGSFAFGPCPFPDVEEDPLVIFTNHNALFSALFLALSILLNAATWRAIKVGPMGQSNNSDSAKIERKLTAYALISMVGNALQAIYYIAIWLQSSDLSPTGLAFVQLFYPTCVNALCFVLPAGLLFWASQDLRKAVKRLLWGEPTSTVVPNNIVLRFQTSNAARTTSTMPLETRQMA